MPACDGFLSFESARADSSSLDDLIDEVGNGIQNYESMSLRRLLILVRWWRIVYENTIELILLLYLSANEPWYATQFYVKVELYGVHTTLINYLSSAFLSGLDDKLWWSIHGSDNSNAYDNVILYDFELSKFLRTCSGRAKEGLFDTLGSAWLKSFLLRDFLLPLMEIHRFRLPIPYRQTFTRN